MYLAEIIKAPLAKTLQNLVQFLEQSSILKLSGN
jgi:hypothetical protein